MTVGRKLFSGFIIVLLLSGAVGWNSIANMKQMQAKSDEISNEWLPGVEAVNNISYLTERVHAMEALMFVMTDPNQRQMTETQALAAINMVDDKLKEIAPTLTVEQEQRTFEAFTNKWNSYKANHQKFVELSKEANLTNGSGKKTQEVQALLGEAEKSFSGLNNYLDALVRIKHDGALAASKESLDIFQAGQESTLYVLLAAALSGFALAFFITRNISRPVRLVSAALEAVSQGRLTEADVKVANKDEIGELVASLNRMKASLRDILRRIQQASSLVADSSKQMLDSSGHTLEATHQVAEVMRKVAAGSEKQVQNFEEANTAMNEMTVGVQRIAETSSEVSEISMEAFREAKQGEQDLQSLVGCMEDMSGIVRKADQVIRELEVHSQKIEGMVGMLGGIAKQTNLLALNASIEAARAGEAGKGFSVVASEVRKLSEQSGQFSAQITELIREIFGQTQTAVSTMQQCLQEVDAGLAVVHTAGESFQRIFRASEKVTLRIQEVAAAAEQMAASSEEVAASMAETSSLAKTSSAYAQHIADTTGQQLESIDGIAESAGQLTSVAEELHGAAGKFQI